MGINLFQSKDKILCSDICIMVNQFVSWKKYLSFFAVSMFFLPTTTNPHNPTLECMNPSSLDRQQMWLQCGNLTDGFQCGWDMTGGPTHSLGIGPGW